MGNICTEQKNADNQNEADFPPLIEHEFETKKKFYISKKSIDSFYSLTD